MQDAVFKADNKRPTELDHWLNNPNAVTSTVYGKDSFAAGFVENIGGLRKSKNKIIALRTSCLHAFPVKMSCYPTCAHKLTKNITRTLITFA